MVYINRDIELEIEKWLYDREIIAIRGPRQSGKTTLLENIKNKLLLNNEENIYFISFENDILRLEFEKDPLNFIKSYQNKGKKNFFLFDEIQYVDNVGKKLKLVFDSIENTKIIITGSSSFDLTNLGKYLVGRILFFDLKPFNFHEFLKTKEERYSREYEKINFNMDNPLIKDSILINELNNYLKEYLTFGGYPRVILEENYDKKKKLIEGIFVTYIEKDIVAMYGKEYRDSAVKILKALSINIGKIIKYENLSQISSLKFHEIKKILPLLEDSYTIKIIRPFFRNLSNELRKNPKIYFIDFGLRNYLATNFENIDFDFLYENFILNQLSSKFNLKYWRTTLKTDVDFILDNNKIIPIESKTSPKITRAIRSFIKIYNSPYGIIANPEISKKQENIYFVPFVYF